MNNQTSEEQNCIGIALSGGGSRAIAFHLGCLRTLDKVGVLEKCKIMSCVSGGSVIGAMYATHNDDFKSFEHKVSESLRKGFFQPTIKLLKNLTEIYEFIKIRRMIRGNRDFQKYLTQNLGGSNERTMRAHLDNLEGYEIGPIKLGLRTFLLERTIDRLLFEGKTFDDISDKKPVLLVQSTELRTGTAFYFKNGEGGCYRYGKVNLREFKISKAVTASAAFPLYLTPMDEVFEFRKRDGNTKKQRVVLVDGAIYDNLGLSALWPDRDHNISVAVPEPNIIISCRAGYGMRMIDPGGLNKRLLTCFYTSMERVEKYGINRLFDLKNANKLEAIVLAFLGQNDSLLECAPNDLVKREEVLNYGTDFFAMSEEWIERLSKRGEQVTLAVLKQHNRDLLFNSPDS